MTAVATWPNQTAFGRSTFAKCECGTVMEFLNECFRIGRAPNPLDGKYGAELRAAIAVSVWDALGGRAPRADRRLPARCSSCGRTL